MISLLKDVASPSTELIFTQPKELTIKKFEERYNCVIDQLETDVDYMSSCVFIDEAAFHINMKHSADWSKKGERAVVALPKVKAKTTTIPEAISPYGVANIRVRRPKVQTSNKKRKQLVALQQQLKKKQSVAPLLDIVSTLLLAVWMSWIANLNLNIIVL